MALNYRNLETQTVTKLTDLKDTSKNCRLLLAKTAYGGASLVDIRSILNTIGSSEWELLKRDNLNGTPNAELKTRLITVQAIKTLLENEPLKGPQGDQGDPGSGGQGSEGPQGSELTDDGATLQHLGMTASDFSLQGLLTISAQYIYAKNFFDI